MENDIKLWLADIKRSITEIYSFLPEEKDFLVFQEDLKTRKAVERNLENNRRSIKQSITGKP